MSDEGAAVIPAEHSDSETEIVCAECCDISTAQDLYEDLKRALEKGQSIVLDAGQVERADTAVLQLLCAFFQDANATGVGAQWRSPSTALRSSARQLGLTKCLGLPPE